MMDPTTSTHQIMNNFDGLCSSTCSCPLLIRLQENFVKKFRVFPNKEQITVAQPCKDCSKELELEIETKLIPSSEDLPSGPYGEELVSDESISPSDDDIEAEVSPSRLQRSPSIITISDTPTSMRKNKFYRSYSSPLTSVPLNLIPADDNKDQVITTGRNDASVIGHMDYAEEISIGYKILSNQSLTPMPPFESMTENELNTELDKYGHRPMVRKKAIALLSRIYEATHPVLSTTTPLVTKISRVLQENQRLGETNATKKDKQARAAIDKLLNKGVSQKIDAPTKKVTQSTKLAFDHQNIYNKFHSDNKDVDADEEDDMEFIIDLNKKKNMETLRESFVNWLRLPENRDLYNELLTMNAVMLDRLMDLFGEEIRKQKCSRDSFKHILDSLHITFSEQGETKKGHYH